MRRLLYEKLQAWKESPYRKPLLLFGARQVGKTWILKEFAKNEYQNVAYINCDNNNALAEFFKQGFDIERLVMFLSNLVNVPIEPEQTLIIFDEIQSIPNAVTALKYFQEDAPRYHVAAAGSLLGLSFHAGSGFPVGKVDILRLYPMTFLEFLDALGESMKKDLIVKGDTDLIATLHGQYADLLKTYYCVGGMPEVVKRYVETRNLEQVRSVQDAILATYELDFSKHLTSSETEATYAVFKSIPRHLSHENKKFIFSHVAEGARARDLKAGITWLDRAEIGHKIPRISKPAYPLSAYANQDIFKFFLADVGLLCALSELPAQVVVEPSRIFTEFKGALTEQYVIQELFAMGLEPYYWSADRSSGEIDGIVQFDSKIYPIEVKAEENLRSKSLRAFSDKYAGMNCRRFSLSNYRVEDWMVNVPLYAIENKDIWK